MQLRRFSIAALIFMGLLFAYVYILVSKESISVDLLGINLPQLPVALWVTVPVLFFYLLTVLYMMYNSFMGNFRLRKYQKDYETLIDMISGIYLAKEKKYEFKTERYQVLANALQNLEFKNSGSCHITANPKVDAICEAISDINDDKIADIKKFNLANDNPIKVRNDLNRLREGKLNSEEILSKKDKFSKATQMKAFEEFVKTSPLYAIENYREYMQKGALYTVLERINADEYAIEASNESIIALMEPLELNEHELIDISVLLSKHMVPDQRIKLFEMLSESNDVATRAYLYTLLDVEMIEKSKEILDSALPEEYVEFRAYLSLRGHNKNYSIEIFINSFK